MVAECDASLEPCAVSDYSQILTSAALMQRPSPMLCSGILSDAIRRRKPRSGRIMAIWDARSDRKKLEH